MTDLYLKAATQAELDTAVISAEIATKAEDGTLIPREGVSIDVIGTIVDINTTDPNNPVLTEIPGWHVNIRADLTPEQEAILSVYNLVPPSTPYRVWA